MKRKSLLDSIKSPLPCSMDWNEMTGDERVRFCAGCRKNVYNLSALTRREATRFAARNSGKVCVRYVRLADGAVETADSKFHQITRRAPLVAAGALGALLAVSVGAQTPATPQNDPVRTIKTQKKNDSQKTSQISFTFIFGDKSPLANSEVKLTNDKTGQEFSALTDSQGVVGFGGVPFGKYKLKIAGDIAQLVRMKEFPVQITQPFEPNVKIELDIYDGSVGIFIVDWHEIPLFQLITQEENEAVKNAINDGFDINTRDKNNETALHIAVGYGNLEIVRFLLERGADVNLKSKYDRTPLLMIDEFSEADEILVEIVRLLVAKGAKVNVQDKSKNTPLMLACAEESVETVKILLEAGANPNLKDDDGETAIRKTRSEEIKQLLRQFGAKEQ